MVINELDFNFVRAILSPLEMLGVGDLADSRHLAVSKRLRSAVASEEKRCFNGRYNLLYWDGVGAQGGVLVQDAPACPEQYGVQAYAHPESCNLFFLCTNGTLTVEHCENGLLFDGKGAVHNHCNYNWAADCGSRKADLTPISTPGCEYQFGIYPHTAGCSIHYVKCAYGEPQPQQCEPGLVYDDRIHGCNWPDLLLDTCNPEAVIGFKCPTKIPQDSVAARFWPYPRFSVPGDCQRLITCVNGYPRLITCGKGKAFDESTLTCEDDDLVPHCGSNHLRK